MTALDCYKVLGLNKDSATPNDIKKAYRKLALKHHPDKQSNATPEEKQKAGEAFQELGKAYSILSDPKRKERYDRTGSMEESEFEGEKDWTAFFKELFDGVVNSETIENQLKKYKESEEETKDVLEAYKKFNGHMSKILNVIEGSTAEDGRRFTETIKKAIQEHKLTLLKHFEQTTSDSAHTKRIQKEKMENERFAKLEKAKSENSLIKALQDSAKSRQTRFSSIIDSIEAKNDTKLKNKRKRKEPAPDLPSEEEFAKLQEKLFKKAK